MMENPLVPDVEKNLTALRKKIAQLIGDTGRTAPVRIMAVTKNVSPEKIQQALSHGITLVGENRVQELLEKYEIYRRANCEIHFIGHLQTNKVKYAVDKVDMIESLDSLHLAEEIERRCAMSGKVMEVLIQVNAGKEESKFGIYPEDVIEFAKKISAFPHLHINGLMAVIPKCEKIEDICKYFRNMNDLFLDSRLKNIDNINMACLSMGMTNDFVWAVKNGATIIRIGRGLFGERPQA